MIGKNKFNFCGCAASDVRKDTAAKVEFAKIEMNLSTDFFIPPIVPDRTKFVRLRFEFDDEENELTADEYVARRRRTQNLFSQRRQKSSFAADHKNDFQMELSGFLNFRFWIFRR